MNTLSFTTRSQPAEAAFAAYHDLYAPVADVTRLADDFSVEVDAHRIGQMLLFDRRVQSVRHTRLPRRVARNAFDHFTAQVPLRGSLSVSTDNGDVHVEPGGMVFIDMSRPMTTDAVASRNLTLSIPRALMEEADVDLVRLHGATIAPSRAGLLRDFMESYVGRAGAMSLQDPTRLGHVLEHLLAVTFEGQPRAGGGRQDAVDLLTRHRVRKLVESDLHADPDRIALAVGRSRSALYRAFEPHGGVARYIQSRRLVRIRSLLADPNEVRSISTLAMACGFASASHCSRAFRSAYGLSPGDFRALSQRGGQPPDTVLRDVHRLLGHWWAEMR
ncbi:helix-turn-helix domain-containing protein [Enterovirga sp. CN4-39]|uniref:helix-turn-helix domain-containing protein n=1 Tax=Enterovirga sp. CN4-39 TaxID=3400910 RepID=UPI003C0BB0A9